MFAPGMTLQSDRVLVTASAGQAVSFFNQGVGYASATRVAIDTAAPAGSTYMGGLRVSGNGAIYGTTALDSAGADVYLRGLRVSTAGQLVYADAPGTAYSNGNPITATGALAVNTV